MVSLVFLTFCNYHTLYFQILKNWPTLLSNVCPLPEWEQDAFLYSAGMRAKCNSVLCGSESKMHFLYSAGVKARCISLLCGSESQMHFCTLLEWKQDAFLYSGGVGARGIFCRLAEWEQDAFSLLCRSESKMHFPYSVESINCPCKPFILDSQTIHNVWFCCTFLHFGFLSPCLSIL